MVGNGVVVLAEAMIVLATVCHTIQLTLSFSELGPFRLMSVLTFGPHPRVISRRSRRKLVQTSQPPSHSPCLYNPAAGQMKQQGGQTWRRKALRVAEKVCQIN